MSNSLTIWWPRYVGDYQRKTAHLSLIEHGAYALLLDHYYSTGCPLPASASVLHRVCRAFAPEEQAAVQSVLVQFFTLEADGYHNKTADEQLLRRSDISIKRQKAANVKHKKYHASAGANADACAGANAHTVTVTVTERAIEADASIAPPPPKGAAGACQPDLLGPDPSPKPAKPKETKHASKTLCPIDFQPDETSRRLAADLGLNLDACLAEFVDWTRSKRPMYADWQATLRNSLRRAAASGRNRQGGGTFGRPDTRDIAGAALRVAARYQAKG